MSTVAATRRDLLDAAIVYGDASDQNGEDPLRAGARLRIMAKAYARAVRQSKETNPNERSNRNAEALSERPSGPEVIGDHVGRQGT